MADCRPLHCCLQAASELWQWLAHNWARPLGVSAAWLLVALPSPHRVQSKGSSLQGNLSPPPPYSTARLAVSSAQLRYSPARTTLRAHCARLLAEARRAVPRVDALGRGKSSYHSLPRATEAEKFCLGRQAGCSLCHVAQTQGWGGWALWVVASAQQAGFEGIARKCLSKQRGMVFRSAEQMKEQKSTDMRTYALSANQETNTERKAEGKPMGCLSWSKVKKRIFEEATSPSQVQSCPWFRPRHIRKGSFGGACLRLSCTMPEKQNTWTLVKDGSLGDNPTPRRAAVSALSCLNTSCSPEAPSGKMIRPSQMCTDECSCFCLTVGNPDGDGNSFSFKGVLKYLYFYSVYKELLMWKPLTF